MWQEHAVATAVLRQLHVAFESAPVPTGPLVLTGPSSGSHHEVGLAAFNVLARMAGPSAWPTRADLPEYAWVGAVEDPSAAVVIAVPTADVAGARRCLLALHDPRRCRRRCCWPAAAARTRWPTWHVRWGIR